MKIAILSYGHFASIFPLAKELSKDHDVSLFLMVYGDSFNESVVEFNLKGLPNGLLNEKISRDLLGESLNKYIEENIKVNIVKYPNLKVKNIRNYLISLKFSFHLRKEKYDIIHFNGIKFFQFVIGLFQKRSKLRWTIHDPFLHSGEGKKQTEFLYSLLSRFKIDVIVHNKFNISQFVETYRFSIDKVHYLPYGIMDVFQIYNKEQIESEINTILFFGRISKYKGLDNLIEAAKVVHKSNPYLKLIIAGKGEINQLSKLQSNTLFEIYNTFVPNEKLVELISRSSIVVCPYTDATQSGVIMTAFALSKPVIATSVGGIPELIENGKTGLLIPPKNIDALASSISSLLNNHTLRLQFSRNIESTYFEGELSWSSISKKLINIYNI